MISNVVLIRYDREQTYMRMWFKRIPVVNVKLGLSCF